MTSNFVETGEVSSIKSDRSYDLEHIFKIVLEFNSVNDRTLLLSIILTNMMELTSSDGGTLYTVEDDKLHFKILQNKSLGIFEQYDQNKATLPPIPLEEGNIQNISAYAAIKNEIIMVDDIYNDERFNFNGPKEYDKLTGYNTKAMLVFPITSQREDGEEVLGVLQLINPIDRVTGEVGLYSQQLNRAVILALTKIAANTLTNLAHVTELQMFLRSFAASMTQAIDERSRYNSSHTQNVAQYCELFAKYLSHRFEPGHPFHFSDFHIESLALAALLHDVGKIITPLKIMDKSTRLGERTEIMHCRFRMKKLQIELAHARGEMSQEVHAKEMAHLEDIRQFVDDINGASFLTDAQFDKVATLTHETYLDEDNQAVSLFEYEDIDALSVMRGTLTLLERQIMEGHVGITCRLLEQIPFRKYYANVPDWAACHHEFLDGTGYPNGLKGDEIPIESCIITIMDIFDALIDNNRPYKKGMSIDRALDILTDMAEKGKLHKELVEVFKESQIWSNVSRV